MTDENMRILNDYQKMTEDTLRLLTSQEMPGREIICDAVRYSLLAGGKRLRPVLMLEFCRMCGGDVENAAVIACTVEMIHTFSLIHDDLPCMDNDDFRRGMPSCHKAYPENIALLAGDALNTMAFAVIADQAMQGVIDARTAVMLISTLAEATGIDGMIGGQVIDLQSEGKESDVEQLSILQSYKTGALIGAACVMGVILAGKYDMIQAAGEYAMAIGRAFQIIDDILDVTGNFEELGKPIGSDAQQNKSTFVTALGIDGAYDEARRLTTEALEILDKFDNNGFMKDLTLWLLDRNA